MSLPTERPTFVLPWIAVILASFAALPVCFGDRDQTEDSAVDVLGLPVGAVAADLLGPEVVPAPHPLLRADGRRELLPFSAAVTPDERPLAGEATEAETEELAVQAGERAPEAVAPAVLSVEPGSSQPEQPREFRSYQPAPRIAAASTPRSASGRRPATRSSAGSARLAAEAQDAPSRVRPLPNGQVELRLTPQAVAFLVQQDLLPSGAPLQPALTEALVGSDETLASDAESSAPLTKAERRKRFKRLVNSDPRRLLEFLTVLTPSQLRELCLALRERGVNVDQFLGA